MKAKEPKRINCLGNVWNRCFYLNQLKNNFFFLSNFFFCNEITQSLLVKDNLRQKLVTVSYSLFFLIVEGTAFQKHSYLLGMLLKKFWEVASNEKKKINLVPTVSFEDSMKKSVLISVRAQCSDSLNFWVVPLSLSHTYAHRAYLVVEVVEYILSSKVSEVKQKTNQSKTDLCIRNLC